MAPASRPEPRVSLLRRLAAALYDALVCAAIVLGAGILFTLLMGGATSDLHGPGPAGRALLLTASAVLPLGYFLLSWSRGGQTIGMRSWRIRLVSDDGAPVSPRAAFIRTISALLSWLPVGLGFWWSLADPRGRAWHDRISATHLERVAKAPQRAR
ncbi:RDD family protein [Thiohalorhabdus sp. Cl-TMA]|uniref:RDD family protein n=1 Tax=Thiohalorhabdus methylotrophus TaxID=3242694 RepID=A0ABV4TU21_9GAMM